MNVYDHVTKEERNERDGEWFVIDADTMYPATILYILENIRNKKEHDGALGRYIDHAKTLDDRAWELALGPPNQAEFDERDKRAEALEIARLVFTELLQETESGPISLYFPRNLKWRLNSDMQVNIVTVAPLPPPEIVYVYKNVEVEVEVEKPQKVFANLFGLKVVKDE